MKTLRFINAIMLIVMILSGIFGYSIAGYSQSEFIDEVKFDPPDPKPGSELKVRITFYLL